MSSCNIVPKQSSYIQQLPDTIVVAIDGSRLYIFNDENAIVATAESITKDRVVLNSWVLITIILCILVIYVLTIISYDGKNK